MNPLQNCLVNMLTLDTVLVPGINYVFYEAGKN